MLQTVFGWLDTKNTLDQQKSEALIALLTLLYQADGKVRWQEQAMFDRLLEELPWHNRLLSKSAFHSQQISISRTALASDNIDAYIDDLMPTLKNDGSVLALVREMAVADGDLDPKEAEIMQLVLERIL